MLQFHRVKKKGELNNNFPFIMLYADRESFEFMDQNHENTKKENIKNRIMNQKHYETDKPRHNHYVTRFM